MIDYIDFGKRIRVLRRAQRITQEELAEQIGISHSFMGHIERGTRIVSLETLVHLCNTLNTTPTHLLEASLSNTIDDTTPLRLSQDQRDKINSLLRMAQETIDILEF